MSSYSPISDSIKEKHKALVEAAKAEGFRISSVMLHTNEELKEGEDTLVGNVVVRYWPQVGRDSDGLTVTGKPKRD